MLMFYGVWFSLVFIMGIFSFLSSRKHLLSTLLSLEFMVVSIYFYMSMVLGFYLFDLYFLIYFLTFSVCEGGLGLSVLVSMIRTHGSDYFGGFNLIQC